MSKKDYIKFAAMLARLKRNSSYCLSTLLEVQSSISAIFAEDNSNFNRERFNNACKIDLNKDTVVLPM